MIFGVNKFSTVRTVARNRRVSSDYRTYRIQGEGCFGILFFSFLRQNLNFLLKALFVL